MSTRAVACDSPYHGDELNLARPTGSARDRNTVVRKMPKYIECMLIDVSDNNAGIGKVEFVHLPRVGEHLALPGPNVMRGNDVYQVIAVLHTGDPIGDAVVDVFVRKISTVTEFFERLRN